MRKIALQEVEMRPFIVLVLVLVLETSKKIPRRRTIPPSSFWLPAAGFRILNP
jgi:hypothetical protein